MDIKNFSATGYSIVDEMYSNFGASSIKLEGWPLYKKAGFAIYEDTSPHADDALIEGVDYTLDNLDVAQTQSFGEDIYTKLTMLTHTTGDIYITYTAIGSYVDADDIAIVLNNYQVYRPTTLNISAGNQTTDLSIYEAGGASEKPNGFKITVSWTGGNKTYNHSFTSGGTINGQAVSRFIGYGAGELLLEKTGATTWITNDKLSQFDMWSTTAGNITKINKRFLNGVQHTEVYDTTSRVVNNANGNIFYVATNYDLTENSFSTFTNLINTVRAVSGIAWPGVWNNTAMVMTVQVIAAVNTTTINFYFTVIGTY